MRKGGRARRRVRGTSRERILDAALDLFGSKGFAGTTTKEIAERARVNEATLFRVFGSKQNLHAAVFSERALLPCLTRAVEFDLETPLDDMILRNVETVLEILKTNRNMFMVMLGDAWRQPKARRAFGDVPLQRAAEFLASMLERQMDAGRLDRADPEVAARALMGMVQFYFLTTYLIQGMPEDAGRDRRFVRGFVSIFLDGLRPAEGGDGA